MHEVIMPKLGLTMESGVIEKWHKKEGDKVEEGDVLFEVMTDKVSLEVEAYNSGILKKIVREEGQEVPVTEVVAYIGAEDEEVGEETEKKPVEETAREEPKVEVTSQAVTEETEKKVKASPLAKKIAEQKGIDLSKVTGTGPGGRIVKDDVESFSPKEAGAERIKISPLARRLAREEGIDYTKIDGTGPGGRIVKDDILKAKEEQKEQAGEVKKEAAPEKISVKSSTPLKGMRKTIAQRMSHSYSTVPHILQTAKADVGNLISLRERLKEKASSLYGVKVTYTDFILKIAAAALKEMPEINSSYQDDNYIVYDDINVGMATAVEEGLIVPTIYNTDKLSILDIAKKRTELIEKAREGKLSLEEISNGTFTVSNLGMYKAVRQFTAIINPPQAAILAVGAMYKEPGIVEGRIEPRSYMEVTLAVDHRILDGAMGARFLERIVELIENPELMVL
ncbi:MAG: dihydrolipoamide acetyltransferase family protein [Actinomycetota bacterium]